MSRKASAKNARGLADLALALGEVSEAGADGEVHAPGRRQGVRVRSQMRGRSTCARVAQPDAVLHGRARRGPSRPRGPGCRAARAACRSRTPRRPRAPAGRASRRPRCAAASTAASAASSLAKPSPLTRPAAMTMGCGSRHPADIRGLVREGCPVGQSRQRPDEGEVVGTPQQGQRSIVRDLRVAATDHRRGRPPGELVEGQDHRRTCPAPCWACTLSPSKATVAADAHLAHSASHAHACERRPARARQQGARPR